MPANNDRPNVQADDQQNGQPAHQQNNVNNNLDVINDDDVAMVNPVEADDANDVVDRQENNELLVVQDDANWNQNEWDRQNEEISFERVTIHLSFI